MYDPIELPSLEQIEQMDRRRDQALDAVEVFDHHVKCQKCGNAVPITGKLHRPKNDRVVVLQRRIKWIEDHYHADKAADLKALKQEIAELLKEDAKADKRRGIPLHYWRGKYVCGTCLDKLVLRAR